MERARVGIGAKLSILLLLLLAVSIPAMAKPVVLELVTLDDFDDAEAHEWQWEVYGSKFASPDYPEKAYVNAFPEALYGRYYEKSEELKALGIHTKWDRKGYNYIEIVPVAKAEDGTMQPSPIPIRGKANRIDLWVWGGNYNYYAEIHLMDFRGVPHKLFLGDLNFQGWQNMSLDIPTYIPQFVKWIPQERPLTLTKIVVWTRPDERVDDFYIYFDGLQVLTDVAENRFDGDQLAQPAYVEQAWQDAKKQGE